MMLTKMAKCCSKMVISDFNHTKSYGKWNWLFVRRTTALWKCWKNIELENCLDLTNFNDFNEFGFYHFLGFIIFNIWILQSSKTQTLTSHPVRNFVVPPAAKLLPPITTHLLHCNGSVPWGHFFVSKMHCQPPPSPNNNNKPIGSRYRCSLGEEEGFMLCRAQGRVELF